MPSATTDLAWSQSIYDALLRIQEEAGGEAAVEIAFTEGMFNVTDAAAALRDYAADGYNLVIAHGTQYGSSLFEIAPDFPETSFAYGTATDFGADAGLENVFAYEARAEEGGYVNGVLAAKLSESGVIGVVGPVEAGDAQLYIDGFIAGAKATNPDIVVNVSYTGSFGDTALAAEAANVHIDAGADILTGSAQQVVGAIGVAKEAGVPWMGTQSDQSPLAPEIVVASQLYDWQPTLMDIIEKHKAGELGGTAYKLTLDNGGLVMDYQDGLSADAVADAEKASAGIAGGSIDAFSAASVVAEENASEETAEEADTMNVEDTTSVDIEPIRIAVVMPSATTDLAWSQSVYDALLRIQEKAGGEAVVEIAFSEGMFNVTDAAAALRDYAADGYNLVIAHGTQYGSSLFEIAPDFPETSFAYGTATDVGTDAGLENIFAYEARAEEGGYVNGVLAASLSESGVIGIVGPVEAGDAKLYIDGFVAGAKATNPDIVVNISYTGSFGDTALAAEAANVHIDAGADILTGSAQQVVGAIGVAKEKGVPWMGTQSDQSPLAPEIVVASQLYDWEPTLLDMIQKHQAEEYGGSAYKLTLENGGLLMTYQDGLSSDAIASAEAANAGVADGSIDAFSAATVVSEESATEEPAEEDAAMSVDIEPIRIAVVMPSATTDLAWSQSIYDALLIIQEEAGGEDVVEIAFTEGMFNVTDAAAALRDYAADDYNLVIAHGTQYGSSLFEIAPDFPDTSFAYGTATDVGTDAGLENVFAYEARAEEGGYVNGVLAASLSESGVIGVVGPVEAGDAKLYIDGFVAGAKDTNPDIVVNISYTGSFGDTALAAEAANVHIDAGADILTGSAQQVVGAIGVAKEKGVPWLGTQSDQSPLAPDVVVASQLYDWVPTVLDMIQKHQAEEYGGAAYKLTLQDGGLVMDYADGLSADAVATAEEAAAGIAAGDISVEVE